MKNKNTALILSVLVGGLGIDRFYLGYTGMGVVKLLTAGVFGVMYVIDIVNIATGKLGPADGSGYESAPLRSPPPAPMRIWKRSQTSTSRAFSAMKSSQK